MNYELLKSKMDKFLAETSPEELVADFEKMGYVFFDLNYKCQSNGYNLFIQEPTPHRNIFERLLKKSVLPKKMTSNFSGSFFLLKIAL